MIHLVALANLAFNDFLADHDDVIVAFAVQTLVY
jgi:hypothetical protein